MDVTSLYTSIPHTAGITAIREALLTTDILGPMQDFLLQLLHIILHKNYFLFDQQFYFQIQGTAMGSNVAPSYANLYMSNYETKYVYTSTDYHSHVLLWLRYLDDIFILWQGTAEALSNFHLYLNQCLPTISFSLEHSTRSIHFLDVLVTLENGYISTDVYRKPTDRVTFLHAESFHPPNLIKSLPYSQFVRIRRITSTDAQYDRKSEDLIKDLLTRGYNRADLQSAQARARDMQTVKF
ncbi:uncharacterized protein PAF06_009397 [Gastrophryne carolinensis]